MKTISERIDDMLNEEEFASFKSTEHNFGVDVKIHVYQQTDRKLGHWARVKIYKDYNNANFTIKVLDVPEVIGDYKKVVTTKELNVLIEKVKKYKVPILNFWNNIGTMVDSDFLKQLRAIDKGEQVKKMY